MSFVMKTNLANRANYGNTRAASNIVWLVFHYTANDGDTDENNGKYFKNNVVKASAHYFVDDDSVTQSVPDLYAAYSVGGNKWTDCNKTGGGKLYGRVTNKNSISIELCDTKRDGTIKPSEATLANAVELAKQLMKKYNIDIDHVIRHFDVNGKHCPKYYMDEQAWAGFKARLVDKPAVQAKPDPGTFTVKILASVLNIRNGPSTLYRVVDKIQDNGVYTIIEEQNGWGRLKSKVGWISLNAKYTRRL